MADLTTNFIGIQSPNPFWLASAPPSDKAVNVSLPGRPTPVGSRALRSCLINVVIVSDTVRSFIDIVHKNTIFARVYKVKFIPT